MNGPVSLRLYARAAAVLAPLVHLALWLRVRQGKEDPSRLGERLGRPGRARPAGRLVWLHGASVGEGLTLVNLAAEVCARDPDVVILLTTGTRASAQVLGPQLPRGAVHQYAPLDTPAAVRRFLLHWRPDLAVFVESELWPNLILAAHAAGVRMALLSARMSPASLRGWRRFPRAASAVLGAFDLVLARDQEAAARLGELGARVAGVADLKTGAEPLPADGAELARLRAALAGRTVVLAASTHPGEEEAALDAFAPLLARAPGALLILAPRHVERGAEIERLARARGLRSARRAAGAQDFHLQCLVADTLGELGLWYRLAAVTLVGGSLVEGLGGHNPFEPARLGCPIAHGPKTEQWPAYDELDALNAARRVTTTAELAAVFHVAVADPGELAAMADRARAYVAARDAENSGLPARLLELMGP